ncbi:MAG TPA: GNAT family N-acetyltransferase, partial [Pontimonas sp.]|nr:GNAT family N-acetyltransferase [Pontimonas sp.]
MSVSRAVPADAHRVSALAIETFPLACPPGTTGENIDLFCATKLSPQAFEAHLADPRVSIWCAGGGDELVGYVMTVSGEPEDPVITVAVTSRPTVEISKIYVRQSAHGSGTAQQLMDVAVEDAKAEAAQSVWLGVNQQNTRANSFYERRGFL